MGLIYIRNIPDNDTTFVVASKGYWHSCYNEISNLTITYDISSSSAIDIIFTPTKKDAENLNETYLHYEACYVPNVLKNKDSCFIVGNGCLVLLNKGKQDVTVNLKYSAKIIE